MSQIKAQSKSWPTWVARGLVFLAFSATVIVLLLWLAGKFSPKAPTSVERMAAAESPAPAQLAEARLVYLPRVEPAVGTIRAVHETAIGSKLLARVVEVNLKAGQTVTTGDVLVRLDDTDLRAKLNQAEAALESAEAARVQAEADATRFAMLLKTNAISRQDSERAATALKAADAELSRAKAAINEIQATLDWATIRSPLTGIVIDKKVDVGDMVAPGQVLMTLLNPTRMQLVASVRESLAHRLQVGQSIAVQIETIDKQCQGTISEIVPEAQAASRAFQVKVTGPCPSGIYSGMFGRILIPLDREQVLMIPRQAVRQVGQLDLVNVVEHGSVRRRSVRLGRSFDQDIEVLSGLRAGERVEIVPPADSLREVSND